MPSYQKKNSKQAALLGIAEAPLEFQEGEPATRHHASDVSMSQGGIVECAHGHDFFDPGANNAFLSLDSLSHEARAKGAMIRLTSAVGESAAGLLSKGEAYAPGPARRLILAERTCRMGAYFVREGDGLRITTRGRSGMFPVLRMQVCQGIVCTTTEQRGAIRTTDEAVARPTLPRNARGLARATHTAC